MVLYKRRQAPATSDQTRPHHTEFRGDGDEALELTMRWDELNIRAMTGYLSHALIKLATPPPSNIEEYTS